MPPCKLELDNTVVAKFYFLSCVSSLPFPLPFFKLLYNFSLHSAIDEFFGVIEIDVTNCAVDKLVFKVIVTQK